MSNLADYLNLVVSGAVQGMIIALAALAISLSFAVARFPNAATGDIMTLGAYTAVIVQAAATGSLLAGSIAAMLVTVALSVASYLLVFRKLADRPLVTSLIASIGIAFFLRSTLTLFLGFDQYVFRVPIMRGINFSGVRILPIDLWLASISATVLAGVFALLFLTPLGRRMRAVAADSNLARASGIRSGQVMITLWAIVGLLSAIAGIMVGIKTVVTPELGWDLLLPAFAAAILGGIGSPVGAVLAAIGLGIVQELSTPLVGFTYKIALSFVALIAVLIIRPQGLFGQAERVR
ncbi:branched-chain amino acid ABC transporter permease [Bosea sp. BIWAKO-01]|uniref:branched-chain amino acid ABC transporter permease n=1 Tax=Bosea sp. BIWAKO-01 TaxID=506668 RepID=UPI0008529C21|nr:branched-chain amino acid ABC transporter permease [Bosea sp. BIWAKO-01]GAU84755.1 high-affinity branched-chain amino acid transport system permease protein LivH [Bosea sp. BIWAKO-01]